jgi:hypothetical protein
MAQKRIEVEEQNRKNVQKKRETVADSLQKYQLAILELDNNTDVAGELGPLQYLSGLTDTPMDKIINILLLVIIFVFDPLAISLVVAANFAFDQAYKKTLYGEFEDEIEQGLWEDEDFDDWDPGYEEYLKGTKLKDDASYAEDQVETDLADMEYTEEDEKRMEVIGQNGNDGEHYRDIEVINPEVIVSQQALKDRINNQERPFIIKTLQENYRQKQVLYSDGTRTWIRKEDSDSNKKRYM